jgi:hypothetical protein
LLEKRKAFSSTFYQRLIMRKKKFSWAIAAFLSLCILVNGFFSIDAEAIDGDAGQFVTMAYNLSKYGELSLHGYGGEAEIANPAPTIYREPGFPAFLSAFIKGVPSLRNDNLDTFLSAGRSVKILKFSQILVVLATALLAGYIVLDITRNRFLAGSAIALIGFSSSMLSTANVLDSEALVAFLVLSFSYSFYKLFSTRKTAYFAYVGLILGVLVLSRAIFMYFLVFALAFLTFAVARGIFSVRKFLIGITVFLLSYYVIVGPYVIRSFVHFGEPVVSGRGGIVLLIRANKDKMNFTEFLGSFIVWTPGEGSHAIGKKLFGEDYLQEGGKLERISRVRDTQSFYRQARRERSELVKARGLQREDIAINDELKERALRQILSNPVKHLVVTLPIAWRGLFVENGFSIRVPFLQFVLDSVIIISLLYFSSLFYVGFLSLKRKDWKMLAFVMPALFMYGMHSLLSHNLARFNDPLIPILVVTLLVSADLLSKRNSKKAFSGSV